MWYRIPKDQFSAPRCSLQLNLGITFAPQLSLVLLTVSGADGCHSVCDSVSASWDAGKSAPFAQSAEAVTWYQEQMPSC
eukprot:3647408-Amphidinium_carterae.2